MAKWGRCDFSQLEAFKKAIDKLCDSEMDALCFACSKALAARLLALVIPKTPVGKYPKGSGKKGGALRRGWTTESDKGAMYMALFGGGNGAEGGTGSQKKVYGQGAVAENAIGYATSLNVTKSGNTYTIEIINPVEYASYVEYGHLTPGGTGWVDGHYMLTISEEKLKQVAPSVLEKMILQKLREVFNV